MNKSRLLMAGAIILLLPPITRAEISISTAHSRGGSAFRFKSVPPPAFNDAATNAEFSLVEGERDANGGSLAVLRDGRLPTEEDQPAANFFFRAGTDGGRLRLDLGSVLRVKQVSSYSWHTSTRAPQVYKLYASDGAAAAFNAAPRKGTHPESCGWIYLASVDTRPKDGGDQGGQHGVAVSDSTADSMGRYRYLLFDISPTEDRDGFGNTFYSEIDVIDADGPTPASAPADSGEPIVQSFEAEDGKYRFTVNLTAAPELAGWVDTKLRLVVQEWYPKLIRMLPSEGFEAATNLTLRFRNDMGGTPASAGGGRINLNSDWFRRELNREALGSVVHEMVHVVQNYGAARRTNPGATRTPGWLVEGIADYIRWFVYEPEVKGAEITERNFARATYNASYRITGNFLNWVTATHDKDIVVKLNAAAREGRYSQELWKSWTGKALDELGEEWKKVNRERLTTAKAKVDSEKSAEAQ